MTLRRNAQLSLLSASLVLVALFNASAACIIRCIDVQPCHDRALHQPPAGPCQESALMASADSVALAKTAIAHLAKWNVPEGMASLALRAQRPAFLWESHFGRGPQSLQLPLVLRI